MRQSSPATSESKRILLCRTVPTRPMEEEIIRGIRRFALNRPAWEIGILSPEEISTDLKSILQQWSPDGFLVISRPLGLEPLLSMPRKAPMVAVDHRKEFPDTVTRVQLDDEGIGRKAAEFFLSKRFRHVAVVSQVRTAAFSEYRVRGFRDRMHQEGIIPESFEMDSKFYRPWDRSPDLKEWITRLPTPIGIYCVMDTFAQQIQEHARHYHLRVPGDVSILGTGNNQEICEVVRPTLSSIPQPHEQCGFRAAELLDDHMRLVDSGKTPAVMCDALGSGEVVERQSTSLAAIPDRNLARAVQYLQEQTLRGGTINEAARIAGLNRRALERGFRKYLGVSPGQYMTEIKLNHAKQLLSRTDLRMWEIAEACRMTQDHFSYLFRTHTGQTPSTYRRTVK